jgi:hypothetical protein
MKFSADVRSSEDNETGNETKKQIGGQSVEVDVEQTIGEQQSTFVREVSEHGQEHTQIGTKGQKRDSGSKAS